MGGAGVGRPCRTCPRRGLGRGGTRTGPLDPALDVALTALAHGERTGRDVAADHAAGAGVGAVADLDGCDEHVVRTGAGVRADHGAVLVHAVVVHRDRRRADVGLDTDLGVADVRQVRHLGPAPDRGVLGLDEGADLAALAQDRARPQVGERAHARPGPDHRVRAVRAHDRGALADLDVGERRVRADPRTGRHARRTVQLGAGQQRHIGGQVHVHVDPGGRRVDDRHPGAHPVLDRAAVELGAEPGQLHPVVDTLDRQHVLGAQRAHVPAVGPGQGQHIGEVELALGVAAVQPGQRTSQHVGVEHVDRGVDLVDRALHVVGVPLLDDREHVTGARLAQHPPVPRRVRHDGGEHRHGVDVGVVGDQQLADRANVEQRHVAGQHDDRPGELAGAVERLEGHLHRAARARHVVLVDDQHLGVEGEHMVGHGGPFVAHDHREPLRAQRPRRGEHMTHEAAPADLVQHLRGGRPHPGAFASSEDDDCSRTGDGHRVALLAVVPAQVRRAGWHPHSTAATTGPGPRWVPATGLRPQDSNLDRKAPKACVLPLHQGGPQPPSVPVGGVAPRARGMMTP